MCMFRQIVNAIADTVTAPIEVVKDAVTLGGLINGKDESYTSKRLKKLADDAEEILDEDQYVRM